MKTIQNEKWTLTIDGNKLMLTDSWGCEFQTRVNKKGEFLSKRSTTRRAFELAYKSLGLSK